MRTIVCDRCNKLIKTVFLRNMIPGIKASYTGLDSAQYDLCLDCMSKFKEWVQTMGVENENDVL